MNIVWYVLCYNEMKILPFIVKYWNTIASKIIVYDDHSTDGSAEYLRSFNNIEVREFPYSTDGTLNDDINRKIKSECWKEQKGKGVDWVIVSDLDEVLWADDLEYKLKVSKEYGYSIITPTGYDFVSKKFPVNDGQYLHDIVKTCVETPWWNKPILINPDSVNDIEFSEGAHTYLSAHFDGTTFHATNMYLFHFKYLSSEYVLNKRKSIKERLSEVNKQNGWGNEYMWDDAEIVKQWQDKWDKAKTFTVYNLINK